MIPQAKLYCNYEDYRAIASSLSGLKQSIRFHHSNSNSSRPGQALASSRYRSNNPLAGNRSGNLSLSKKGSYIDKCETSILATCKNKSPKNPTGKPTKPHSILDLLASKSPVRRLSRSPNYHHQPIFLKELHSARNNLKNSFRSSRNHTTAGMRSQHINHESELRNVHQTQIIPVSRLADSDLLDQVVLHQTPNKLNDSDRQGKLFHPRRNRPNKLNVKVQGIEQKLRNLLIAHKASDEAEVINETQETRVNRKSEVRNMT